MTKAEVLRYFNLAGSVSHWGFEFWPGRKSKFEKPANHFEENINQGLIVRLLFAAGQCEGEHKSQGVRDHCTLQVGTINQNSFAIFIHRSQTPA